MMNNNLKYYENITIEAARLGGDILNNYFNNLSKFNIEKDGGIVTKADKESEDVICSFFNKKTPDFSILSEESGLTNKGKNRWIIDPLDGTTNFFHGFPHFSISIALKLENEIVVGVVYNPVTKEIYHAIRGSGAYKNNKHIFVSNTKKLSASLIGTGFAYMRSQNLYNALSLFRKLTYKTHGIRRPGSAALDLCYIASGIYDGFYEKTLKAWDVAAGALLVEEAGGQLSNYSGEKFSMYRGEIVASNKHIHREILKTISSLQGN